MENEKLADLEYRHFEAQENGNFENAYQLELAISDLIRSFECDRCNCENCICGI